MHSILIAGVDLGTTKTCAVIAEVHEDPFLRRELKILGVGQAKSTGMRQVVTHIEETTESVKAALEEAELMAGVHVDRVYVGISGEHIRAMKSPGVVAVSEDEVSRFDLQRVHEVARAVAHPPNRELLHAIPQDYIVDHQRGIKDPIGMVGTRLEAEVYLVTGSASAAENIRKSVQRAGYRVQELVLEPLAAARAVLTEDEKEVGVAMVEMGACTTDLAAYYNGEIRHVAVLPAGGITVTNDLVRGLSIPFAEAKKAMEHFGVAFAQMVDPQETVELPGPSPGQKRHVARELIAHVMEQRLDEMFGLVPERARATGPDAQAGRRNRAHRRRLGTVWDRGAGAAGVRGSGPVRCPGRGPRWAGGLRGPSEVRDRGRPRPLRSRSLRADGGGCVDAHIRPRLEGRLVAQGIFLGT